MTIWFLYDNHSTSRIGEITDDRVVMMGKAKQCFLEDGCGSLIAYGPGQARIAHLAGYRRPDSRYGVRDLDLQKFFDAVDEYVNWIARG